MSARPAKPATVGDALASFLAESGLADRVAQAAAVPEWASLVGPQIAAVTEPLAVMRDGTMVVAVRTHSWMSELSLLEPQLLAALNGVPGRPPVTRLHWRLMR